MFRFLGKTLLLGGLGASALGCLYGKDQVLAWFQQGKQEIVAKIDELQGMRGELRSIESRVQSLEVEIRQLREHSIGEEVEVKRLEQESSDRQGAIERLRKNLEKAQSLLAGSGDRFVIGGTSYSREQVEHDVAEKLDLWQVQQDTLAQLQQTLAVRRGGLELARENVARGEALRGELTGKLRLLEAKLEKHRAREIYAEAVAGDFDAAEFQTAIGEVRQACAKFEGKLEVKARMLDERLRVAAGAKPAGIDYESPAPSAVDVTERLSRLLGPAVEPQPHVVVVGRE
jgi:septal ring factor EnvC (AmiA/AmiB activator)